MFNFLKKHFVEDWSALNQLTPEFTPDIATLEQRVWNWVFIPDECMQLGRKHELVQDSASGFFPFYEDCYTSDKFTYLEKYLGKESQGLVFKTINDGELPMWMNKAFRVKGEVYALTGKQIISLDNYKKNTVYCDRVKVNINIPYTLKNRTVTQTYNGLWSSTYHSTKPHITSVPAFLYISRMDYWRDQLLALDNFRPVFVQNDPDRIYVRKYYDYNIKDS